MGDETTTTTLDDLVQAALAEAYMVLSQGADLSNVILQRPLERGKGSVKFPKWGSVTAAAVNEATDLSNTAVSTSSVEITPVEHGVMTTITDQADWKTNPVQVGTDIGRLFADALKDLRNQDIWALFAGFTQTAGSSNTDVTEAALQKCLRLLVAAKAPRPYYFAFTPHVFEDLLGIYDTNTNITPASVREAVVSGGVIPTIFGLRPLLIDNLASGTSAGKADAADAKCGVFSGAALGYVFKPGSEIKIETQRDASLRAFELVATSVYAVGEIEDNWGVELLVDNKD